MDEYPPSFFNRLTDPDLPAKHCSYTLSQTEAAVMRDLEELLNTKRPANGFFDGFHEVERSVANFGLRDVTHINGSSPDERQRFADHVRHVIEMFEPRLTSVDVTARNPDEVKSAFAAGFKMGAIYFRVRATLNLDPTPIEGVVFDTVLHLTSGQHEVRLPGGTG